METIIKLFNENTSGNSYGGYTDKSIVIIQRIDGYENIVFLDKKELQELETVIGAKFKA